MHLQNSWCLIVNPVASSGRGLRLYPRISRLLREAGVLFEPRFTEHHSHAVELTVSAVNDGFRKIAVLGGDGTLHDAINGLFIQQHTPHTEICIAHLSTCRPRGWDRASDSRMSYARIAKAMSQRNSRLQDLVIVSYEESHYRQERYMSCVASIGFEAFVIDRFTHLRNKGATRPWRYAWNFIRALFRYKSAGAKVWVDDLLEHNNLLMNMKISISGCHSCSSSYKLSDKREAHNPNSTMSITLTEPLSLWSILFNIRRLRNNKLQNNANTIHLNGKRVRIESIPSMPLEIDGEVLGDTPIEFHIVPQAIRIITI